LGSLDPLGINRTDLDDFHPPELEYGHYGFTESDMDRTFHIGQGMLPGFSSTNRQMTLRQIIQALKDIYCMLEALFVATFMIFFCFSLHSLGGTVGIEYSHIPDRQQCDWLRSRVEVPVRFSFSTEEKRMILDRLIWSDSFERFVATKWSSEKRFGLEGCEALIPGMKALVSVDVRYLSF
jgi:2-oxoglutarate dehydrogenase E1 component